MKVLSVSNLCFLAAITIGLAAVWSVASPAVISGENAIGSAGCCAGAPDTPCGPRYPNRTCDTGTYPKCDTSGTGDCEGVSGANGCTLVADCAKHTTESCGG